MNNNIRILSTKILKSNQKQFLLNAGFRIIEADFIHMDWMKINSFGTYKNLIFTSQNAVLSLLNQIDSNFSKDKQCFCVGIKTKNLLEENGFKVITYFHYAEDLANFLIKNYPKESFTFFSGNLRKDTVPKAFFENDIVFEELQAYRTQLCSHKIETPVDAILFFSPSAVHSYLEQNTIQNEICFCVGKTTAEALYFVTKSIVIANQPSVENVIIQCIHHYNKSNI